MKAITLILAGTLLCGCGRCEPDPDSLELVEVCDQTDPLLLQPDIASLSQVFNFTAHPNREITYRVLTITDKKLNETYGMQLADGAETERQNSEDDVNARATAIQTFCHEVKRTLSKVTDTLHRSSTLSKSECYSAITKGLSVLAASRANHRVLWVHSNLFENAGISVYTGSDFQSSDTNGLRAQFLSTSSLPDNLHGIDVWLLFRPASRSEDLRYTAIAQVYTALLTERGAQVFIAANNPSASY